VDLTSSNLKTNVEGKDECLWFVIFYGVSLSSFMLVLPQFSPDPIADISCGYNHLAALSDSGVLYTCKRQMISELSNVFLIFLSFFKGVMATTERWVMEILFIRR